MTSPIIVGGKEREASPPASARSGIDFSALVVLGAAMMVVGSADLTLLFIPNRFGIPEWEFTTAAQFAAGMPVATTGIGILAFAAAAAGRRLLVGVAGAASVLYIVALLVMGTLFALTMPLALKAGTNPTLLIGIKKAIVKGCFEIGLYLVVHTALAIKCFRATRVRRA